MIFTAALLSTALATADADPTSIGPTVETDGVRVAVTVQSQVYTWEITNVAAAPIERFELPVRRTYNYEVPVGWAYTDVDQLWQVTATDPSFAIAAGETKVFSMRAGSGGPVLNVVPMTVSTADGATIEIRCWGPGDRRPTTSAMIVGSMALIAVGWIGLQQLSDRRRATR